MAIYPTLIMVMALKDIVQVQFRQNIDPPPPPPKADLIVVQTHNLQIIDSHFMFLRCRNH